MSARTYKPILVRMMSYLDDQEYERDTVFTQAQLGALTENTIMKWLYFEVFKVPEPGAGHDLNPLIRSNTIKYWKKALSFFMPNRLTPWNELTGHGNPTRSKKLNDLIKFVKRKEVRGQGAPLVVTGNDGEVYIDEIPDEFNGVGGGAVPAVGAAGGAFVDLPIRQQLLAMHLQLLGLRRSDDEMRQQLRDLTAQSTRQYQTVNANIRRIAVNPVRRAVPGGGNGGAPNGGAQAGAGAGAGGNGGAGPVAALSSTPRDLYVLWQEYQVGIGGRKAARMFSAYERGRVKHKYTRRKVVWTTIDRLVRGGLNSNVAIDRIYNAYGRDTTVTNVINRMLADRRSHTVPANLQ